MAETGKKKSPEKSRVLDFLKAHAPAEDLASYDAATLAASADLGAPPPPPNSLLMKHRAGESLVSVDNATGIERQGRPMTVITVVNDNKPFLFNSVLSEITLSAGEPALVLHPVLAVKHGKNGVSELLGEMGPGKADDGVDRVSLIHVHIPRRSDAECKALAERIRGVLKQVRAAVSDWKPMLARLDQAISDFRYAPVPMAEKDVAEAIAFLEWLRDDNFTFLGIREYRYRGGEETGELERMRKPGLGILQDPDVQVLRRGDQPVTASPEIRAFLHGPDPLIVTKANSKSVVHRRIYLDYIGIKTFDAKGKLLGELRIVGLFTSTAYTRSVLKIPYLRSKVQAVIEKVRLRRVRSFGQGADQCAGILSARRAVPGRHLNAQAQRHGHPGTGRASARAGSLPDRPVRPLRLRSGLRAARPLRFRNPPEDRELSGRSLRRAYLGLLPGLSRRLAGAGPFHHRAARRQDADTHPGDPGSCDPRHRAKPGKTRSAKPFPTPRPSPGLPTSRCACPRATATASRPRPLWAMPAASNRLPPSAPSRSTSTRWTARRRRRSASRSTICMSPSRCRGACHCWSIWAFVSSASAPSKWRLPTTIRSFFTTWSSKARLAGTSICRMAARC